VSSGHDVGRELKRVINCVILWNKLQEVDGDAKEWRIEDDLDEYMVMRVEYETGWDSGYEAPRRRKIEAE
jgi:hypothetical protein